MTTLYSHEEVEEVTEEIKPSLYSADASSSQHRDVKFEKAYESLPLYCLSLMEAPRKQQLQLGKMVKNLYAQPMENLEKTTLLGIALIKIVGDDLLRQAVKDLGERIKDTPSRSPMPVKSRKSP